MGTVTAQVTDSGGQTTSKTVAYTVEAAHQLRIGWSCPISSLSSRLAQYPKAKYIRIFRQAGQGFPTWSSLSAIPNDVAIHLSVKDVGLDWPAWLSSRPAARTAKTVGTYAHEADTASTGDPSPAVYQAEWQRIGNSLVGHPRRADLILAPVYTRWVAELDTVKRVNWYRDYGKVVENPAVDAVAFDVYNPGSTYQTSPQMFDWVCGFADANMLPLYIAEWGRERMGADNGTACAQLMRDDITYLRSRNAAGVAWFYQGGDNLDTGGPNGGPRTPERDALANLIAEAL